ncbi:MAG TPA: hypothetical protein VFU13_03425, partial [Steroidobacteraceae bacterium]|nr:hypothetical protein [Steroidobacteraceae bacterium]
MNKVRFVLASMVVGGVPVAVHGQALPPPPAIGSQIRNPVTGAMETVDEHPVLPFGTVRTSSLNYIWYGPTAENAEFDIPAQAAIPPTADYPGQAALSARHVRISSVTRQDDNDPDTPVSSHPVISITYVTISGDPSPSPTINVVSPIVIGPLPPGRSIVATPGSPELPVPKPGGAPPSAGDVNAIYDSVRGAYGSTGADGWGFEVCFFGCVTIGDDADGGGPGSAPTPLNRVINASDLLVANGGNIRTEGDDTPGIAVLRQGGNGGDGGDAWGALRAANGGAAGAGGQAIVTSNVNVHTEGEESYGVWVQSRAGIGGSGGSGYILSTAGGGGPAAQGGFASGTNNGIIVTEGDNSIGLYVQSIGGGGGAGGDSYGLVGDAGHASQGGHAGDAVAVNNGTVFTGTVTVAPNGTETRTGAAAHGVFAQSVGGRGGNAGTGGGIVGLGGDGATGGNGGSATATNGANAHITTQGDDSHGLYAQSIGGGGGDGGSGGGIAGIGGQGAGGGDGRAATANNNAGATILTTGEGSFGILAQSVGGGGGNGGNSGGIVAIGGGGTSGGQGGLATINNRGAVETRGDYAHGVVAQSIGGGGGTGGNGDGLAGLGGGSSSSTPNHGGVVRVENFTGSSILTRGQSSYGVLAQSIGGGGGSGAGSGGLVTVGGSGGAGGNGNNVTVINNAQIQTLGADGKGIVAQSIGGGGGSASASTGAVELGGQGAGGGNGLTVTVENYRGISTVGRGADGIFAQSIGGGGGNGASSSGVVALGGSGAGGGNGGTVNVTNAGAILTQGARSRGIMAESVGGGGGSGGEGDGLVGIGGSGGSGGAGGIPATPDVAGDLTIDNSGVIVTLGNVSSAIEARSVGGGGGSGGNSGSVLPAPLTIGGRGGDGGSAGAVDVTNNRDLLTVGADSHGIYAQAIGGGGGNGGNSTSVSLFGGAAVGGSGGLGGNANTVTVAGNSLAGVMPTIETRGDRAKGIFAQSVGGGGGNGGFAVQASAGYVGALSAAVGGAGGGGGEGRLVDIDATADITTRGFDADGILAQSVGGGGGNGGFAMSFAFSAGDVVGGAIGAAIGGEAGNGGAGGVVDVDAGGSIHTLRDQSDGLIAQSIGGGGGNGGYAITLTGTGAGGAAGAVSAAIGGSGGLGGNAGQVDVDYTGDVHTEGDQSTGVVAQAIGGGGGNGGYSIAGAVAGAGGGAGAFSVGVGGSGGNGGTGGIVDSTLTGNLTTEGDRSTGMVVQSVGGSGGNGGFTVTGSIAGGGAGAAAVSVGVGGSGGGGGNAGNATGTLIGDALTSGVDSDAVVVQSIGGGGGNGGFSVSGSIAGGGTGAGAVAVGIGGAGGGAGNGLRATGTVTGNLTTLADGSSGLVAQSVGGGGGNGGFSVAGVIAGGG